MLGHTSVGGGSLLGVLSTPGLPHPIPGVAAVHEQPPSTLQLVNLLAQLLNLFRQAALCQADRVGAREGQRRGRGTKRTAELRRSRRTPCKVPGQTHITLRDEVQLRVSGSAGGRARRGGPVWGQTLPECLPSPHSTPRMACQAGRQRGPVPSRRGRRCGGRHSGQPSQNH